MHGLHNLGNTCYINTILQCLRHCSKFSESILQTSLRVYPNKPEHLVYVQFKMLLSIFKKKSTRSIHPKLFVQSMQRYISINEHELYNVFIQNDAHEFLLCILNTLHEALQKSVTIQILGKANSPYDHQVKEAMKSFSNFFQKEYSPITEQLTGQYQSIVHNIEKNTFSYVYEPFLCLGLQITNTHLYDCLNTFIEVEKINSTLYKSIHLWKLPDTFIITLKRFSNGQRKNTTHVQIPILLQMQNYVTGPSKYNSNYRLQCVCNHQGNLHGGHYYAYCYSPIKKKWFMYNDQLVQEIPENKISTSAAYCLFYTKI